MKATLNLRKNDLLAKLNERKVEVEGKFDARVAEIQAVIDDRKTAKDDKTAHAEWYEAVAEGLRSGEITFTQSGKLRNAPPKPGSASGSRRHGDWSYYNNEELERQIRLTNEQKAQAVKPLDTAIDLLNLSTDETVEIDSSDYQALLSGQSHRIHGFAY